MVWVLERDCVPSSSVLSISYWRNVFLILFVRLCVLSFGICCDEDPPEVVSLGLVCWGVP